MENFINSLQQMTHWTLCAMIVLPVLIGTAAFFAGKREKLRTVLIWMAAVVVLAGGLLLVWQSVGGKGGSSPVWEIGRAHV